jgi:membrane associated rhomboid family serine protease
MSLDMDGIALYLIVGILASLAHVFTPQPLKATPWSPAGGIGAISGVLAVTWCLPRKRVLVLSSGS